MKEDIGRILLKRRKNRRKKDPEEPVGGKQVNADEDRQSWMKLAKAMQVELQKEKPRAMKCTLMYMCRTSLSHMEMCRMDMPPMDMCYVRVWVVRRTLDIMDMRRCDEREGDMCAPWTCAPRYLLMDMHKRPSYLRKSQIW